MKYISIFSGIEAASVAFEPLGWQPIAFSKVDQFPCAVLKEHYPDVPNLGDIRQVDWSPYRGAVDLVIGGSPCQSFSIAAAANRNSLDGEPGTRTHRASASRAAGRPRRPATATDSRRNLHTR